MIAAFITIAILCTIYAYQQEKRRKRLLQAEAENRKKSEQLAAQFQQMLVPINEMTELMYVSDINTYDLLFINEAGKKLFHIDQLDGLKCYKALQGFDAPCSFCPNAKLSKEETYTWEHTNPLVNGHFLLKDRLIDWEGRPARMEIAFDITDTVNEKKELECRVLRDRVMVDCIRELYQNHQSIDAINRVLELVGEVFDAERAYVFFLENDEMSNIAEWCKEGISPQIEYLQHMKRKDYTWWFQLFDDQVDIMIKDVEEIKDTKVAEYELLSGQGINRLVLVPLEPYGEFGGMIGLDNLGLDAFDSAVTFLRTLSYFIMLAMRRNEDENVLYQMSYLDTLTSFYNRNRYIQDVEALRMHQDCVGVAFIDLNGLKEVNDRYGHSAGDELLKTCASIIQSSIQTGNFYRVGGDEFVVLSLGVDKKSFHHMMDALKTALKEQKCEAAVGYQWTDSCRELPTVIKTADQYMYEDKKAFYQKHQLSGRYRHQNEETE